MLYHMAYSGDMRNAYRNAFWSKNLKRKFHLQLLDVERRI
jgi:hypothetical protein